MHKRLGHKPLALVTGASSGIGLEFARLLSEAGCELVLVSNDAEKLQAAADELQANSICMDLSERDSAEKLFDWCNGLGLEVDLLVNNAGMFFWDKMNEERLEVAEELLRLNGLTPMKLCVLFGEQMKSRGCGYIINVASSAAQLPFPGLGCYSGSKALLKNYSKSLLLACIRPLCRTALLRLPDHAAAGRALPLLPPYPAADEALRRPLQRI